MASMCEVIMDDILWGYNPYKGYYHKGAYETLPRDKFEKLYFELNCINDDIDIDSEEYKVLYDQWVKLRKIGG